MKKETQDKIKNCKTVEQYLDTLLSEFKTSDCKPSRFIKNTLIYTLAARFAKVRTTQEQKTKALETESLTDFIKFIKKEFDCSDAITPKAAHDLIGTTETLVTMVRLEENGENHDTKSPLKSFMPVKKVDTVIKTKVIKNTRAKTAKKTAAATTTKKNTRKKNK